MKLLIVKTSSLGDVIHAIPALVDAKRAHPDLQVTWLVEEAFAPILEMHPWVDSVMVVALRRWRREWRNLKTWQEMRAFIRNLRSKNYDLIIDAQGTLKSALWTRLAKGRRVGFHRTVVREKLAAFFYQDHVRTSLGSHIIPKLRHLFAGALNYTKPEELPDYAWQASVFSPVLTEGHAQKYILFVHGSAWKNKRWPLEHWRDLAELAMKAGYEVHLCFGNAEEEARSHQIAEGFAHVKVLPKLGFPALFTEIAGAKGVISGDTGLAHIATALNKPVIALYGPSSLTATGVYGPKQRSLSRGLPCAPCVKRQCRYQTSDDQAPPCMEGLLPHQVWQHFLPLVI
jgi:heptosyltransferase-1